MASSEARIARLMPTLNILKRVVCRHEATVDMLSPTASFNVWPKNQFFSMKIEMKKKTKFRHARTACGGLWDACGADLLLAPKFKFTHSYAAEGCSSHVTERLIEEANIQIPSWEKPSLRN